MKESLLKELAITRGDMLAICERLLLKMDLPGDRKRLGELKVKEEQILIKLQ